MGINNIILFYFLSEYKVISFSRKDYFQKIYIFISEEKVAPSLKEVLSILLLVLFLYE